VTLGLHNRVEYAYPVPTAADLDLAATSKAPAEPASDAQSPRPTALQSAAKRDPPSLPPSNLSFPATQDKAIPGTPADDCEEWGAPLDAEHFFEVLSDIDPIDAMGVSYFALADTVETSPEDQRRNVAKPYANWNPWRMIDVCGPEMLQELQWEDVMTAQNESQDSAACGGTNWLKLFQN
jgi:hypothetical protein